MQLTFDFSREAKKIKLKKILKTYLCFNQVTKSTAYFERVTFLEHLSKFLHTLIESHLIQSLWIQYILNQILQFSFSQHFFLFINN